MMFSIFKRFRTWKTKKNELIKILENDRAHNYNEYIRAVAIALSTHWHNWEDMSANTFLDTIMDVEQRISTTSRRYLNCIGITEREKQERKDEIDRIFYSHRDKIVALIREEFEMVPQVIFDAVGTLILPSGLRIPRRKTDIAYACHNWKKEGF